MVPKVGGRILLTYAHQPGGIGIGQIGEQDAVDHGVDRGRRTDGDAEHCDDREGEGGIPAESARKA